MSEWEEYLVQSDGASLEPKNVTDALLEVSRALNRIADAIYEVHGGPWPKALADALSGLQVVSYDSDVD